MTKCVRLCGAYTYRLTKRHSMLLLVAIFLLLIVLILHLYARRHRNIHRGPTRLGDYEYRPGLFLKGHQPNDSVNYCQFNYGLPDELQWNKITTHPTPEMGSESPYRVIYEVITGTAYSNRAKHDAVTYATQATPEFLYHVVEIARFWDGPISLSVFVPNYDMDTTIQIFKRLCRCYVGMSKISLHIFYPRNLLPVVINRELIPTTRSTPTTIVSNMTWEQIMKQKRDNYRKLTNKTRAEFIIRARQKKIKFMTVKIHENRSYYRNVKFADCSGPDVLEIPTYRKEKNLVYPINVGRNVARNASRTNYFLVSDIEMVPSEGLAQKFLRMVKRLMGEKKRREGCVFAKTVFVVPLFEVERGEEIPRRKDTLVQLVANNRATYFHQRSCSHCQRFPGLQTWLAKPPTKELEPMIISKREYPYHRWEPLYFGTQKEPWYSEMLSWEGRQDKMTQMLELCLQEYRLVVLDGGFLCHAAARPPSKHAPAEKANSRRYASILSTLKQKYNSRPQCIVH